jgi:hypothetical protein
MTKSPRANQAGRANSAQKSQVCRLRMPGTEPLSLLEATNDWLPEPVARMTLAVPLFLRLRLLCLLSATTPLTSFHKPQPSALVRISHQRPHRLAVSFVSTVAQHSSPLWQWSQAEGPVYMRAGASALSRSPLHACRISDVRFQTSHHDWNPTTRPAVTSPVSITRYSLL